MLRFDLHAVPAEHLPCLWIGLPIMVAVRLITLRIFGVNRGLYRFVSIDDFVKLSKAIALGSVVFMAIWLTFLNNFYFMPRSIYILESILCMSFLAGSRVCVRLWRSRRRRREQGEESFDGGSHGGRVKMVEAAPFFCRSHRSFPKKFSYWSGRF